MNTSPVKMELLNDIFSLEKYDPEEHFCFTWYIFREDSTRRSSCFRENVKTVALSFRMGRVAGVEDTKWNMKGVGSSIARRILKLFASRLSLPLSWWGWWRQWVFGRRFSGDIFLATRTRSYQQLPFSFFYLYLPSTFLLDFIPTLSIHTRHWGKVEWISRNFSKILQVRGPTYSSEGNYECRHFVTLWICCLRFVWRLSSMENVLLKGAVRRRGVTSK